MKFLCTVLITLLTTTSIFAHESNREIQLKAANDELTKRVAELLDENSKLKAHVTDIVKQMREAPAGKKVVVGGCNAQGIQEALMLEFGRMDRHEFLGPWLEKNGKQCTEEEPKFIEKTLIPEVYYSSRPEELVRYFGSIRYEFLIKAGTLGLLGILSTVFSVFEIKAR